MHIIKTPAGNYAICQMSPHGLKIISAPSFLQPLRSHKRAFLHVQGWLDVTYTSQDGNFRLSRGNKGTLFILVREEEFKSKLEEAISAKEDDKVCAGGG